MHTSLKRACVLTGTTALLGLAAAGTASAHVTANAPDATQGGYSVITFRVPTESETATTTGLVVTLPADVLKSVRTEPMTGWTSEVAKSANGTPTAVSWKADAGTSIGADQFGEFRISVGPLPKQASISFDAKQDYSDGSVVEWNEAPKADGSEPEHPAPEVALAAEGASGDMAGMTATAVQDTAAVSSNGTDDTARWLAGAGLVVGALGLGIGGATTLRARRATV